MLFCVVTFNLWLHYDKLLTYVLTYLLTYPLMSHPKTVYPLAGSNRAGNQS